ncbi:putative methyltransferase C20orf7-like protein, mitochondrial [Operophtera brumata]|uniref:Putative methyltransferase C20orf7-like protein, mitochondrial n=1 Tax=Operophtera brumata TaxID=104452 RepID=A0A0L7KSV1_OPEBR|nr:putative methyltransferase C20orf7-like protein, mitochondrial [Operophtera brumata]
MCQTKLSYCLSRLMLQNKLINGSKYLRNSAQNVRHKSASAPKQKTASSVYRTMNIFDRKAKALQRERSARSPDYHLAEYIKEEVGWRTADRIFDIKRTFKNATHLDKALVGEGVKVERVVMDEENIELAETERAGGVAPHISPFTSVRDIGGLLTASGFTLQTVDVDTVTLWYPSAWHVMHDVRALGDANAAYNRPLRLNKHVQFIESGFTLQTVDVDTVTLWYPSAWHVMHDVRALGDANAAYNRPLRLNKHVQFIESGFTLQTVDVDTVTLWYPSAWHVMHDVRALGDANAAYNRPLRLNKHIIHFLGWKPDASQPRALQRGSGQVSLKDLHKIDEIIQDKTKDFPEHNSRGVPATYQIIHFLGWKPDSSQPRALQRGSGQVSLKDLHKIDEIIQDKTKVQLTEEDMK